MAVGCISFEQNLWSHASNVSRFPVNLTYDFGSQPMVSAELAGSEPERGRGVVLSGCPRLHVRKFCTQTDWERQSALAD